MKHNTRRETIKKLSLFAGFCVTGGNLANANSSAFQTTKGLVLKAEEGEVWYIGNTRKAEVIIKVAKSDSYEPEISLLSERIPVGDAIPVHKHGNEEEFLFVQKGQIEIYLDDETHEGNAGDLIYVPRNTWHGFKNKGKEEVILFFGYSPAGFEAYFRAIGTKHIDDQLGFTAKDWQQTNQKYGVVYKK
ncbi:MAG: hypothetical protein Wins2KO_03080 [Winogradskyella sp.]